MGYLCPYCKQSCFEDGNISRTYYPSHGAADFSGMTESDAVNNSVVIRFSKCPNCGKTSINMTPYRKNGMMRFSFSYPQENFMNSFPDYVPVSIRSDYLEAASIVDLSPKASATLARRCLQGMIHDFWGIKEKNLNAEITALNGKIPTAQWKAIDGLRKIGNIGAHMEKDVELIIDVDPGEAKQLLKLIELLIEKWYVARHDEEQLLAEITAIAEEKENERKSVSGSK